MQSLQSPTKSEKLRRTPKALAGDGLVIWAPATLEELAERIPTFDRIYVGDTECFRGVSPTDFDTQLSLGGFSGTREVVPADQIAVFGAGISLKTVNNELATYGYTLPVRFSQVAGFGDLEGLGIGDLISLNIPNPLGSQYGNWSDWILGMTIVLADGRVVKAGSRVVKNVAGYDLQKLMIGARYTLGIATEYIVRITPLKGFLSGAEAEELSLPVRFVHKVLLSKVGEYAPPPDTNLYFDAGAGTVFGSSSGEVVLPRSEGDWVIWDGCGSRNIEIKSDTVAQFMIRAKEIFDERGRLNPGEFGFM